MNILICTFGSHGDVHPYLALGWALKQLGHHVTLATSSVYGDLVHRHGLDFAPVRPEVRMDDQELFKLIIDARRGSIGCPVRP